MLASNACINQQANRDVENIQFNRKHFRSTCMHAHTHTNISILHYLSTHIPINIVIKYEDQSLSRRTKEYGTKLHLALPVKYLGI